VSGAGIFIQGANDSDVINLGAASGDEVAVGGANETVNGGAGAGIVLVSAGDGGALLHGGSGQLRVFASGGGALTLNAGDSGLNFVVLSAASSAWTFTANGQAGLYISDASTTADTLTAGGAHQIITGGAAGHLTMAASAQGGDTFRDTSTLLNGDTIENFATTALDTINITDLNAAQATATFTENAQGTAGQLSVTDGTHSASITLFGQFMAAGFSGTAAAAGFSLSADSLSGTDVRYQPLVATPH